VIFSFQWTCVTDNYLGYYNKQRNIYGKHASYEKGIK